MDLNLSAVILDAIISGAVKSIDAVMPILAPIMAVGVVVCLIGKMAGRYVYCLSRISGDSHRKAAKKQRRTKNAIDIVSGIDTFIKK